MFAFISSKVVFKFVQVVGFQEEFHFSSGQGIIYFFIAELLSKLLVVAELLHLRRALSLAAIRSTSYLPVEGTLSIVFLVREDLLGTPVVQLVSES